MDRRVFMAAAAANLVALPLSAKAQQKVNVRRIGILFGEDSSVYRQQVLPALHDLGWVEGRNLAVEGRYADGNAEILPTFAAELVRLKVELIVTAGTAATIAAKNATASVPIIMLAAGDPVRSGLVASLARPGGNITGNSLLATEIRAKRLQLLHELLPGATRVGELVNPSNPFSSIAREEHEQAYRRLRIQPIFVDVVAPGELENAIAEVARQRGQALIVTADPLFWSNRVQIMRAAQRYALPTMVEETDLLEAGGLAYYGASAIELGRRTAVFIDKILKGASPADLPVEQLTKFELVINLKTAKALDLTIPPSLLLRAVAVIQ